MPGTPSPYLALQWFTNAGAPAVGYQLFTYGAGTSTKVSTYTDIALATPNTNPIILDAAGRATIFLTPGVSYKYVMALPTDTDPPASPIWTRDNISAVPPASVASDLDVSGVAGEPIAGGDAVYLSDGSGGQTAGRWFLADADNTYSSTIAQSVAIAPAAVSTSATGTFRRGGRVTGYSSLTPGTLYYISATAGALTATPPTNARVVAQADSATSVIVIGGNPDATATTPGNLGVGAQDIAGVKNFLSVPTGLNQFKYARLASDFTKNANITPSDVTALAFAVAASEVWAFRVAMRAASAAAADWRFRFTGPAAPTSVWYGCTHTDGTNPAAAAAFSTDIFNTGFGATIWNLVTLEGLLRNGANAGTVQFQAAQWTSDVSNSVITAGAYIQAWRVE